MGSREPSKRQPGLVATLLGFGLIVGLLDVNVVGRLVERVRTYGFAEVSAEVVESYVEEHVGRRGRRSYDAVVRYAYQSGGRSFEGTHRGRGDGFDDSEATSVWTVDRHPPGLRLTAYHDPADAGRSVLIRGVRGEDLYLLLFAVPFNLLSIGMLVTSVVAVVARRRGRPDDGPGPGVPVREIDGRLHVRLPTVPPNIVPALTAAGVAALASALLIGIGWSILGATDLPHWLPISGLWWALLAGVFVYGRSNPGRARTGGELIVDRAARTLTLPPADGGGDPKVIRFDQVMNVRGIGWADKQAPWWGSGVFHPTIAWREERGGRKVGESLPLGAAADRAGADRFARWLEMRVGLRK